MTLIVLPQRLRRLEMYSWIEKHPWPAAIFVVTLTVLSESIVGLAG
jgi:hypothetical protein